MRYIYPFFTQAQTIPLYATITYKSALELIERCARNCYQSEKYETGQSVQFLDKLYELGHYSVFEHSNFVIKSKEPLYNIKSAFTAITPFDSRFIDFFMDEKSYIYYGGNLRAWFESLKVQDKHFHDLTPPFLIDQINQCIGTDFEVVSDPRDVPLPLRRMAVKIIHDRAFTHELVRHRVMSFSQESQRYCNYTKGRFSKEITYIVPVAMAPTLKNRILHYISCWVAEKVYFALIALGSQPQIARSVLPNSCKTSIYVSGNRSGWEHLFELRTSPKAHPDMISMMVRLKDDIIG